MDKKYIFQKKLALDEYKEIEVNENINKTEDFLESIKVIDSDDDIMVVKRKLENGTINEEGLTKQQVEQIKELYICQINDLINSINKYKNNIK